MNSQPTSTVRFLSITYLVVAMFMLVLRADPYAYFAISAILALLDTGEKR